MIREVHFYASQLPSYDAACNRKSGASGYTNLTSVLYVHSCSITG